MLKLKSLLPSVIIADVLLDTTPDTRALLEMFFFLEKQNEKVISSKVEYSRMIVLLCTECMTGVGMQPTIFLHYPPLHHILLQFSNDS